MKCQVGEISIFALPRALCRVIMNLPEMGAQEQRALRGPRYGQEVIIPCMAHYPKFHILDVPEKKW